MYQYQVVGFSENRIFLYDNLAHETKPYSIRKVERLCRRGIAIKGIMFENHAIRDIRRVIPFNKESALLSLKYGCTIGVTDDGWLSYIGGVSRPTNIRLSDICVSTVDNFVHDVTTELRLYCDKDIHIGRHSISTDGDFSFYGSVLFNTVGMRPRDVLKLVRRFAKTHDNYLNYGFIFEVDQETYEYIYIREDDYLLKLAK